MSQPDEMRSTASAYVEKIHRTRNAVRLLEALLTREQELGVSELARRFAAVKET